MVDFHTHILPEMDDGSKSIEESVQMLKMLEEQGIKKVLLSPHFYACSSDVERFNEKRESSLEKLIEELGKNSVNVELYLGCEVLYFDELWRVENLENFCIKGTKYILVEMPFSSWPDSMVDGVGKLISKGLTPVLAHFERYLKYKGNDRKIYELMSIGVLLQMNCEWFIKFTKKRKALWYLKNGFVSVLGSDCHNLENRAPNCKSAYDFIRKKLSSKQYAAFLSRQQSLFKDAKKVFPVTK